MLRNVANAHTQRRPSRDDRPGDPILFKGYTLNPFQVEAARASLGGTVRYLRYDPLIAVDALVGYGYRVDDFVDESPYVYDWFGRRVGERSRPGEVESMPHDRSEWQHGVLARAHGEHAERRALTPPPAVPPVTER